jgi:uncharacterized membrane protein YdjX (TVP38/TMEM64 family)
MFPPIRRFLPLLLLFVVAVSALALGLPERLTPDALTAEASHWLGLSSSRPWLTFSLICTAIALVTAIGLPGAFVLFAAAGFLLGVPAAMAAAALGNAAGTSILFFALRAAFFKPSTQQRPDEGALHRIRAGFERNRFAYALFLRALPVLPNGAVTIALSALRCSWPVFIASSAFGPQANAVLMGWLGAQLALDLRAGRTIDANLLADPRWWLPALIIALLALVPILLRRRATADPQGRT